MTMEKAWQILAIIYGVLLVGSWLYIVFESLRTPPEDKTKNDKTQDTGKV